MFLALLMAVLLEVGDNPPVDHGTCTGPAYEYCQFGCEGLAGFSAKHVQSWGEALDFLLTLEPKERISAQIVQPRDARISLVVLYRPLETRKTDSSSRVSCMEVFEARDLPATCAMGNLVGSYDTNDPGRPIVGVYYRSCP